MSATVCVVGAGGGIGQPLSLLLKQNLPHGSTLKLFDVMGAPGVAADLSHVDSNVSVEYAAGKFPPVPNDPGLAELAKGVDVFVIVAGVPRKPGMTRDDLFKVNAGICLDIVSTCAKSAPKACFCVVTNPVNATVAIAATALKKLGVYDKNKLFGVSTLDVMRATRFVNVARSPGGPLVTGVPVIGGHSDTTIVPLLSQLPGHALPSDKVRAVSERIQTAGTEVVKAKAGKGSATLSMAAAGARFALAVVDGLTGRGRPTMYTYVDSDGTNELAFFAMPVVLGPNGIAQRLAIGPVNDYEKKLLGVAVKGIAANIKQGEAFAREQLQKSKL